MKPKLTQTQRILKFLLKGGRLTCLTALHKFNCWSLRSRISNIRAMQKYNVKSEMITLPNNKRVARYSIEI